MPKKQDTKHDSSQAIAASVSAHIATERAIDELRRQLGVVIHTGPDSTIVVFPVEFADSTLFADMKKAADAFTVLLTASRVKTTRLIDSSIESQTTAFACDAKNLSLSDAVSLANPLSENPLPNVTPSSATAAQQYALQLAKYAALLPAMLCAEIQTSALPAFVDQWYHLHAEAIDTYSKQPLLDVIEMSEAALPIDAIENSRIVSFRARYGTAVHLALLIGDINKTQEPLVRVHSSCVTGDILGSLRCDCGDQLKYAINQIASEGCGIILYLHQEGRGIGINNKLRAYQLQERGIDTYDANLLLGFEEDERDFSIASAILKKLDISSVRLLTNNPQKLDALEQSGTHVTERVAIVTPAGKHNHAYIETKARKSGHLTS